MLAYNQLERQHRRCKAPAWAAMAEKRPATGDPGNRRHGQYASTSGSTSNAGAYQGYFNIGPGNDYSSSSTDPNTDAINVANQICAMYSDSRLWAARLLNHGQPRLDPVHRVRGHLRALDAVVGQFRGDLDVAIDLDDRRFDLPQLGGRCDQRLQMVHRHALPAADEAAASLHHNHG